MNTNGSNRSVHRTQDILKKGLLELLLEKPIQKISVKELTEYVNINRGTFYLHYDDIYDLLEQMEEEIHDESRRIVEIYSDDFNNKSIFPFLKDYFQFLKNNQDFFRIILQHDRNRGFIEVWLRNDTKQSADDIAALTEDIILHGFDCLNSTCVL